MNNEWPAEFADDPQGYVNHLKRQLAEVKTVRDHWMGLHVDERDDVRAECVEAVKKKRSESQGHSEFAIGYRSGLDDATTWRLHLARNE